MTKHSIHLLKVAFSLLIFLLSFCLCQKAYANANNLILTEVYYNASTGETEWFELYNNSGQKIDLSKYHFASNNEVDFTLPAAVQIESKEFFIIAADAAKFQSQYGFLPDLDGLALQLGNESDYLAVKDDFGEIVDGVAWGSDKFSTGFIGQQRVRQGNSTERNALLLPFSLNSTELFKENQCPNPKRYFASEIFPANFKIKSLYPSPQENEEEYIEVENITDKEGDLFGWKLSDPSNDYYFRDHLLLAGKQSLKIPDSTSKIFLNDQGDTISLSDPNGGISHTFSYTKSSRGEIITQSQPEKILEDAKQNEDITIVDSTISDVRKQQNGREAQVIGVVTAIPGDLSANYFYIQDDSSGIQIYSYYATFPTLKKGDKIRVSGELSSTNGDRRIKINQISDITILSTVEAIGAASLVLPEIGENSEGKYIKTQGIVVKKDKNSIIIRDLGHEIKIIDRQNKLNFKSIKKQSLVEISGIVSEYRGSYRILPTGQEDVKIINSGTLPRAGLGLNIVYFIIPVFLQKILCILFQKMKLRQRRLHAGSAGVFLAVKF